MFRSTNLSKVVTKGELGMIHDGARIATDALENTPLRQSTISEYRLKNLSSKATVATSRRLGSNGIFGPISLHSSRRSSIFVKGLLVFVLVSWSTFVLSFRFDSKTSSVQYASQLRGDEKQRLNAQTTNLAQEATGLKHYIDEKSDSMKLSLWLIPSGGEDTREQNEGDSETVTDASKDSDNFRSVYSRTQKVIDDLSHEHGGPRFIPHVTLGGASVSSQKEVMELVEQLRTGLAGFGPVECVIGEHVLSGNTWNQALVFELDRCEDFLGLCKASRKILGMTAPNGNWDDCLTFPPPLRVPHMSLYYGMSPPSPSEKYLTEVFGKNKPTFRANRIMLWKTDPSSLEGVPDWESIADISIL